MKKLLEELNKKRYRTEIFVDVFAESSEEAERLVKDIQSKIPNSYLGSTENI